MSFSTHRLSLLILLLFFIFAGNQARGQVTIHGTVYNMYHTRPLDGVSVVSGPGRGTTTDSNGNYVITVNADDSIYFSYLGRATGKYPVKDINYQVGFDIALRMDPTEQRKLE